MHDHGRRYGIKTVKPATNSSFDTPSGASWCHACSFSEKGAFPSRARFFFGPLHLFCHGYPKRLIRWTKQLGGHPWWVWVLVVRGFTASDEFASLTKWCRKAEDGQSDDLTKWNDKWKNGHVDKWTKLDKWITATTA